MVSGSKDLKDLNLKKMDKLGIGKLRRGYSRFNVFIGGLVSVFMCLPFVSCGISVYNRGETNAVENGGAIGIIEREIHSEWVCFRGGTIFSEGVLPSQNVEHQRRI
ncbi:hypothetical protein YC2023_073791 [Brassica napus]